MLLYKFGRLIEKNENREYVIKKRIIPLLNAGLLSVTDPRTLNDPFDGFVDTISSALYQVLEHECKKEGLTEDESIKVMDDFFKINDSISQRIVSFTGQMDDLLWAHYGSSHQGILYVYDTEGVDDFIITNDAYVCANDALQCINKVPILKKELSPINYCVTRPTYRLVGEKGNKHFEFFPSNLNPLLIKSTIWAYENETRLILSFDADVQDSYLYTKVNPKSLKKIVFGCKVPKKIINEFIEKVDKSIYPSVEYYKMVAVAVDRFSLVPEKIS